MKDSVGVLLKRLSLAVDKQANSMASELDMTYTQMTILQLLYDSEPATIRPIDIEEYLSVTNPTVTGILNNMERSGLIRRVPNPADGRSKMIDLTPRAVELKDELTEYRSRLDESISINLSPEELEQMIGLLNKMLGREGD